MRVLMVGVDRQTKGGMWTVAENYLQNEAFCRETELKYIPTSVTGSVIKRCMFSAWALLRILVTLIFDKRDIVHVHMSERGSVYRKDMVMRLARRFGCRVVIHMHGAEFQDWYQALDEDKKAYVRGVLDRADKVIILGKYWEEFISGLVADPGKVQVVYNAVRVPEENRYNKDAKNLLFLGAVCQRKGVYDLVQAMKLADEKLDEGVRLWIYGPDVDGKIRDVIKDAGMEHRAEYRGWLGPEKEGVFAQTAVNVLPSYNEGLPMTILETMAYGIPNISTGVAAIPEAVNDANGALVRPGDPEALARAIVELMDNAQGRKSKSEKAWADARAQFGLEGHMRQILEIYRNIL